MYEILKFIFFPEEGIKKLVETFEKFVSTKIFASIFRDFSNLKFSGNFVREILKFIFFPEGIKNLVETFEKFVQGIFRMFRLKFLLPSSGIFSILKI